MYLFTGTYQDSQVHCLPDLGCGHGAFLPRARYQNIRGTDISPKQIELAPDRVQVSQNMIIEASFAGTAATLHLRSVPH